MRSGLLALFAPVESQLASHSPTVILMYGGTVGLGGETYPAHRQSSSRRPSMCMPLTPAGANWLNSVVRFPSMTDAALAAPWQPPGWKGDRLHAAP